MKILSRHALLTIGLTGFILSPTILFPFIRQGLAFPADRWAQSGSALRIENTATLPNQERISSGLPIRLKIPKIRVNAAVEHVGMTPAGAMDVPKNPSNAGWFNLGQRPGQIGSAVIAGHYGRWRNGKRSVFDNLYKLRKGDKLYIEDDTGTVISFVVRETRKYDPDADASDVFGSNDGKAHLNLITCEGAWNRISKSYPKRLIIFTDKE